MGLILHQVAAGVAPRDAISHHLLRARELLRAHGYTSEIYAEHIHPELASEIRPAAAIANEPAGAAVLHYSINSPVFDLALERFGRTALHYHNITPADLLWRHAPAVARQCAAGRRALGRFASAVDRSCADSEFNATELRGLGARDVEAVGILRRELEGGNRPPARRDPDPRAPRLLFVGRGVPNKAHHDLILAIAALHETGCQASLKMVGSWDAAPVYERYCRGLAAELGVDHHVAFAGAMPDEGLRRAYREADLFLCLSDHEGFCVPLLEALDVGLPIVGFDAGAVAETLGGAGLVLPTKEPSVVAEAVRAVVDDDRLRAAMLAGAEERLRHFASEAVGARLLDFARRLTT